MIHSHEFFTKLFIYVAHAGVLLEITMCDINSHVENSVGSR
jgi:hypothetical protein